jgi:hypothetical protein
LEQLGDAMVTPAPELEKAYDVMELIIEPMAMATL